MSEKLTVWVFQTGEPLPVDEGTPRPMRAINLTNALMASGHNVVLWSSAFNHQKKIHRTNKYSCITVSNQLEVRLIPSPGYQKNVSFSRLWDHFVLAHNFKKILKLELAKPNVAFVGYPPIETASVMVKYLEQQSVPCLLDVKDQWPSFLVDALPESLKIFGRIALAPYFYIAKNTMKKATGLSAMAGDFLQWALDFSGRTKTKIDLVVPLTTPSVDLSGEDEMKAQQWWTKKGVIDNGKLKIMFVGSHYPSLDFAPIFVAADKLKDVNVECDFIICGHGDLTESLLEQARDYNNIFFPGWLDRPKVEVLAKMSAATIAPFKNIECFTKSLPNKVIDSLSLGLPIISPLEGEVRKLIDREEVGLVYNEGSGQSLFECVLRIKAEPKLLSLLAENAINLYENKFSYEIVYGGLVKHLEAMARR